MTPSPPHAGTLSGLAFHRSRVFCHSHCMYVCMYATAQRCPENSFSVLIHHLSLLRYFCPLFCNDPSVWRGGHMIQMSHLGLGPLKSLLSCPLTSRGSALITIYDKKRLLWWGLRAALIYACKSLDISLIRCSSNKIIAIGSLLGSVAAMTRGLGLDSSARLGSDPTAQALNPIRKWYLWPLILVVSGIY